jgi:formylglycine-generating enzyme required for sulfatase activity
MALVQGDAGPFCIHAYELHVEPDPTTWSHGPAPERASTVTSAPGSSVSHTSFDQARQICAEQGMHLCTSREWERACKGPADAAPRAHPTPDGSFHAGQCGIQTMIPFFHPPEMPAGAYAECRTPEGVYDLLGNAWEWVDPEKSDAEGRPVTDKRGGAHYSGRVPTCDESALGRHAPDFVGTITFRCCKSPR